MVASTKKSGKTEKKRVAAPPLSSKASKKVVKSPLFQKAPRNFRVGGDIQPRRNLSRFVRWPKYIVLQRQRRVLLQRLKIPPAINQFNTTLDKNQSSQLFRLLAKYKPENKSQKKERLAEEAKKQVEGQATESKKPVMLKYGVNHVTDLIEIKKAKLIIIAHDVDPIELVCWLPALCRSKDIPYCIIKGKSRLGKLVHKKTCSVIALDNIRKEDQSELEAQCKTYRSLFNDNTEVRRKWGGGSLGIKSQHAHDKKERLMNIELKKKMGLQVA